MEAKIHGLNNLNDKYTFFYDETNNIRKLYIKEDHKLNVPVVSNFVLGGVVSDELSKNFDIRELRERLKLDKDIFEIKTKHIAKGNFKEAISSKQLNGFLKWLFEHRVYIHYSDIDPIYWSIVDIIDSVLAEAQNLYPFHFILKAELNSIVALNFNYFIQLLGKYNYPDIPKDKLKGFVEKILELVENHEYDDESEEEHFNHMMLKGLIQMARKQKSLEFIQGYKGKSLIDEFTTFYVNRIIRFENSRHCFDEEPVIANNVIRSELLRAKKIKKSFIFKKSHDEVGIQVSDVMVGVLGKLFTFMRLSTTEELIEFRKNLDDVSLENLHIIATLTDISATRCKAFLNRVVSHYDRVKEPILLS